MGLAPTGKRRLLTAHANSGHSMLAGAGAQRLDLNPGDRVRLNPSDRAGSTRALHRRRVLGRRRRGGRGRSVARHRRHHGQLFRAAACAFRTDRGGRAGPLHDGQRPRTPLVSLAILLADEDHRERINAVMRKAACCPFQTWDCHIAYHSPPIAVKPTNQIRSSLAAPI